MTQAHKIWNNLKGLIQLYLKQLKVFIVSGIFARFCTVCDS